MVESPDVIGEAVSLLDGKAQVGRRREARPTQALAFDGWSYSPFVPAADAARKPAER
jgi:hypothetical protein